MSHNVQAATNIEGGFEAYKPSDYAWQDQKLLGQA